jgi:hypothetical protein
MVTEEMLVFGVKPTPQSVINWPAAAVLGDTANAAIDGVGVAVGAGVAVAPGNGVGVGSAVGAGVAVGPGVAVGAGNGVTVGVGTAVGASATVSGVRDMVASGAGVAVGGTSYGAINRVISASPLRLSDAKVLLVVSVPPQTIW